MSYIVVWVAPALQGRYLSLVRGVLVAVVISFAATAAAKPMRPPVGAPPASTNRTNVIATAWLGVVVADGRTRGLAAASVQKVFRNTPAHKAGLQAGDLVLSIDAIAIRDASDLINVVGNHAPGDVIGVEVFRGGVRKTFKATLAVKPSPASLDADIYVGKAAPEVALAEVGGGALTKLEDLLGNVVVLYFFSRACSNCLMANQTLAELSQRGVVVLGVAPDLVEELLEFCKNVNPPYSVLHDSSRTVERRYGVRQKPTIVVIDKRGVVAHYGGGETRSDLDAAFDAALAAVRVTEPAKK